MSAYDSLDEHVQELERLNRAIQAVGFLTMRGFPDAQGYEKCRRVGERLSKLALDEVDTIDVMLKLSE